MDSLERPPEKRSALDAGAVDEMHLSPKDEIPGVFRLWAVLVGVLGVGALWLLAWLTGS